jgi:hypothetical protein
MSATTSDPLAPLLGASVTTSTDNADSSQQAQAVAHREGPSPSVSTPPSPQSAEVVASSTPRPLPKLLPEGAFTDLEIRALASLFALLDRWDKQPAANDNVELDPE